MDMEALDFQLLTRRLAASMCRFVTKVPQDSPGLEAANQLRISAGRLGLLCAHYSDSHSVKLAAEAESECISICYWLELLRDLQASELVQIDTLLVEARSMRELLRAEKKRLQA